MVLMMVQKVQRRPGTKRLPNSFNRSNQPSGADYYSRLYAALGDAGFLAGVAAFDASIGRVARRVILALQPGTSWPPMGLPSHGSIAGLPFQWK